MGLFSGGTSSSTALGGAGGLGGDGGFGGAGGFGGYSSNSGNTTDFQFNPIFNFGGGNENDVGSSSDKDSYLSTDSTSTPTTINTPTTEQKNVQTATTENQDEFGLSAGVAVGSGSSAMGGAVGVGQGEVQPIGRYAAPKAKIDNKMLIYGGLSAGALALVYTLAKPKGK